MISAQQDWYALYVYPTVFITWYLINKKIQNFSLCREWYQKREKCTEQEVSWDMSWKTVEIEIASAENRKSTLVIAIADIMTGFTWLIKYLGNKLLYSHVPDLLPWCGIGSGHTRLGWYRVYIHHMHPRFNWVWMESRKSTDSSVHGRHHA